MIQSVVLNNHVAKPVSAVKFGWIIITEQDFEARKNRDAAVVGGYTQAFDLELSPLAMKRIPVYIEFVKEAKSLIKAGVLSGTFYLRIRISELHFKDGTAWAENDLPASSKKYSHMPLRSPQLSNCPDTQCNFHENGQGYCNEVTSPGFACLRHPPCNPADATVVIRKTLARKFPRQDSLYESVFILFLRTLDWVFRKGYKLAY